MSKTIEISREMAENLLHCGDTASTITPYVTAQLRALLAAPVVERQEPVFMKPQYLTVKGLWIECEQSDPKAVAFYTSPPAPVAVAPDGWRLVPLHPTMDMLEALMEWNKVGNVNAYNNILNAAPTCLDKVKELNQ